MGDLDDTQGTVYNSECLISFCNCLSRWSFAYNSSWPLKGTVIRFSKGIKLNGKQKDGD